jgi:hypothetical protein
LRAPFPTAVALAAEAVDFVPMAIVSAAVAFAV